MSETVASIVAAHRTGTVTPEQTVARSYARVRANGDAAVFITMRPEDDVLAEARALAAADPAGRPLYGVPVAVKDNIDVAACRPPRPARPLAITRRMTRPAVARLRAGRRHRHRQDQSRPVRDRPRRHALALWHPAQHVRCRAHPGRLELGLGGRGRRRSRAVGARHRHGRLRPRAGGAQQYRRP